MVKCPYLCTQNVHINDNIQWNQTHVLYNDHLMCTFMYPILVSQYLECSHKLHYSMEPDLCALLWSFNVNLCTHTQGLLIWIHWIASFMWTSWVHKLGHYHTTECVPTKFRKCTLFCKNASESMMYNVAFGNNL